MLGHSQIATDSAKNFHTDYFDINHLLLIYYCLVNFSGYCAKTRLELVLTASKSNYIFELNCELDSC